MGGDRNVKYKTIKVKVERYKWNCPVCNKEIVAEYSPNDWGKTALCYTCKNKQDAAEHKATNDRLQAQADESYLGLIVVGVRIKYARTGEQYPTVRGLICRRGGKEFEILPSYNDAGEECYLSLAKAVKLDVG